MYDLNGSITSACFMFIGSVKNLQPLLYDMSHTLLLRDTQYLANPGDKVQFLGRMIVRREGGYDLSVNRGLAE